MGFLDTAKRIITNLTYLDEFFDSSRRERLMDNATQRDYYMGHQRRQLKVKPGQSDDNLVLNYSGLIVDRGISMLLGQGVEFDLPGDPTEVTNPETGEVEMVDPDNQRYIDAIWRWNKRDILLHKAAQFGGVNGTCYIKLQPDYFEDPDFGPLPRLIPLDPLYMTIDTNPEDIDEVVRYTSAYTIIRNGQEVGRKEVVEKVYLTVDENGEPTISAEDIAGFVMGGWVVQMWENSAGTGGKWQLMSEQAWEWDFPPIIHWQNLPMAGSIYGKPDISDDVLAVQDRINFISSNISKIIRYHSHPKTWGRGAGLGPNVNWGADEVVMLQGDGQLSNLEMQSDLASSQAFLATLRQSIFDIARTVDLSSMQDKLGALTNFGLRVLFFDSLAKLKSKRELYGEALVELNHRLLALWGADGIDTDGGTIVWQEVLPVSETEQISAIQADINLGILSKETAAGIRGYDWRKEQERIDGEQANQDSIGARLLSAFERGQ